MGAEPQRQLSGVKPRVGKLSSDRFLAFSRYCMVISGSRLPGPVRSKLSLTVRQCTCSTHTHTRVCTPLHSLVCVRAHVYMHTHCTERRESVMNANTAGPDTQSRGAGVGGVWGASLHRRKGAPLSGRARRRGLLCERSTFSASRSLVSVPAAAGAALSALFLQAESAADGLCHFCVPCDFSRDALFLKTVSSYTATFVKSCSLSPLPFPNACCE